MAKQDDLLTKLAKRKGITDPKGLAAWIKKHKKKKGIKDDVNVSLLDRVKGVVAEEDDSLFDQIMEADIDRYGKGVNRAARNRSNQKLNRDNLRGLEKSWRNHMAVANKGVAQGNLKSTRHALNLLKQSMPRHIDQVLKALVDDDPLGEDASLLDQVQDAMARE